MSTGAQGKPGRRGPRGRALPWSVVAAFAVMCIAFAVVLAVMGYTIRQNRDLGRQTRELALQGKQAHDAICTLKDDYRTRIHQGAVFLRDHPNGIPGIKVGVIRESVANEQKTLDALRLVRCITSTQHREVPDVTSNS